MSDPEKYSKPGDMIISVIDEMQDWILENIEKNVTASKVIDRSGYSRWHFQRKFHQHSGLTLSAFIVKAKAEQSRHDIIYTRLCFTEIAAKHGFKSIHTFMRAIKRVYRMTPGEMRNGGLHEARDILL